MKLWGLMRGERGLAPVALPRRADVQDWAGQRHMPVESYRNREGSPSDIWHEVKRLHPDFRLVRVTVDSAQNG